VSGQPSAQLGPVHAERARRAGHVALLALERRTDADGVVLGASGRDQRVTGVDIDGCCPARRARSVSRSRAQL